jgi:hypothetical protein
MWTVRKANLKAKFIGQDKLEMLKGLKDAKAQKAYSEQNGGLLS